jgi:hypothetical protein
VLLQHRHHSAVALLFRKLQGSLLAELCVCVCVCV